MHWTILVNMSPCPRSGNHMQHHCSSWTKSPQNFKLVFIIQGGPERTQHLWSIISMKSYVHYCVWNLFPARSLTLMKAFWFYCRFSEARTFSKCAILLQTSRLRYRKFSIVWLPRLPRFALALKNEDSMIKEKHSLRNFAVLSFGGSYSKKFPPYLNSDFYYKSSKFRKFPQKKWL